MRYRYLVDLRRGISVFAIFSYGIAVLGTPQCPPLYTNLLLGTHTKQTNKSQILLTVPWFFVAYVAGCGKIMSLDALQYLARNMPFQMVSHQLFLSCSWSTLV